MSKNGGGCHLCCFKFIITSGLLALFIWLSLRTTKPSYSITDFYLPALNKTDNSISTRLNHTLSFTLHFKNKMKDKGVKYGDIQLSFFYGSDTSFPVGNATVGGFDQGHGKKADKRGAFEARGVPWEAVLNGSESKAVFRVDLVTRVRYKILFWYTKGHNFVVRNTTVEVDDTGKKSGASPGNCSGVAATVFSLVLFVLILVL